MKGHAHLEREALTGGDLANQGTAIGDRVVDGVCIGDQQSSLAHFVRTRVVTWREGARRFDDIGARRGLKDVAGPPRVILQLWGDGVEARVDRGSIVVAARGEQRRGEIEATTAGVVSETGDGRIGPLVVGGNTQHDACGGRNHGIEVVAPESIGDVHLGTLESSVEDGVHNDVYIEVIIDLGPNQDGKQPSENEKDPLKRESIDL